ncbi:MAG: dihydroxy-acid dehydratase [Acidimicrobiales bacterium]
MTLRSAAWLDGDDEVALDARVALAMGGNPRPRSGTPVIGLANGAGDLNPCNQPLVDLVPFLRAGVEEAGGVAVEFPVMSLGEDLMKPAAMLYRNLVAMEVEESLRSLPLDGVIVLAACDKSVPAGLMGTFSANLPTLLVVAGPRPVAHFRGRRVGTGTDLWRTWDERRSGRLDDDAWAQFEAALALGRGTCNTMGTASSMGVAAETLGLAWPGSTSIPAGDHRHAEVARAAGLRAVAMVRADLRPASIPRAAFVDAARVLSAAGGSTNAVIHLTALARRLGLDLSLQDFDDAGRAVPVLVDVEPTGAGLMEDFDLAGGTPTLWRAMGDLLDGTVTTASGMTLGEVAAGAREPSGVIRSRRDPVDAHGAFRVVRGNLAPDGALIKRSAATPALLRHRGPAVVLRSAGEAEAFGSSPRAVDPASVVVLSGAGPVGGPGMPEWGMVSLPPDLLARGVTDMVRVTDARMSGTSFGTVFLHVAPEAAVGGPLGLVEDGDVISVDADGGLIELEVADEELARRRAGTALPRPTGRGYLSFYAAHVQQAPDGCDFDFLAGTPGEAPRLDEPVVGRS